MQIGIISEGHSDRAVIVNILSGVTGLDPSDFKSLRPIYAKDETDQALDKTKSLSSYSVIKEECESKELIEGFLSIKGQDFVVLHIDTAEADKYGVDRPPKKKGYCEKLRKAVVNQINIWLEKDLSDQLLYAVAIEEMDAWILTIYDNKDSTTVVDAKKALNRILNKKGVKFCQDPYDHYFEISKPLSKKKAIQAGQYLSKNCSLSLFFDEIFLKLMPRLKNSS